MGEKKHKPRVEDLLWIPQSGPQQLVYDCPIEEILVDGNRGGGKSELMLGKFLWHMARNELVAGKAGLEATKGIIIRETSDALVDLIQKAQIMYSSIATFNKTERTFKFFNGAILKFRHYKDLTSSNVLQGHAHSFIGVDELTQHPTPQYINMLALTLRPGAKGIIPLRFYTTNPGGPGNQWVRERFVDGYTPCQPIQEEIEGIVKTRVRIPLMLQDNKILEQKQPGYLAQLLQSTEGLPYLRKAHVEGDWNCMQGAVFGDVWREDVHVLPDFQIPTRLSVFRSYDWGQRHPGSIGWYAICDGAPLTIANKTYTFPRGTLIKFSELYLAGPGHNQGLQIDEHQVIERILKRDAELQLQKYNVGVGVADVNLFSTNGRSEDLNSEHRRAGLNWMMASNEVKDRIKGKQAVYNRLSAGLLSPMEDEGLFVTQSCITFRKQIISLFYDNDKPGEDIAKNQEDHCYDETRYACTYQRPTVRVSKTRI